MPNYNLKQIFEIGVDATRQPVHAFAYSQAPNGADPILGATARGDHTGLRVENARALLMLRTKTVAHVAGHTRIIISNPSTFRGSNRGLFVSFPHLEKQREPVVQKIKRTWEDKNSIDRRLFEMMLKSSEHIMSSWDRSTIKRQAVFKESNQQEEIQSKNGGYRRVGGGHNINTYKFQQSSEISLQAQRNPLELSYKITASPLHSSIVSIWGTRLPACPFQGPAGELNANSIGTGLAKPRHLHLRYYPQRIELSFNARPLESRTLKGYFVALFEDGDRQVATGAKSEATTQKKALIDEKIEYHTLLNIRKIYNEFSGTKNHVFEFLKTFCNFILSFEAGAFTRTRNARRFPILGLIRTLANQDQPSTRKAGTPAGIYKHSAVVSNHERLPAQYGKNRVGFLGMGLDIVQARRKTKPEAYNPYQDPINLLAGALLEDVTQSTSRLNVIKKIESKAQTSPRPLTSCRGVNEAGRGRFKLPLVSTNSIFGGGSSLSSVEPSMQNGLTTAYATEKQKPTQKSLLTSADYRITDATAGNVILTLPHLFLLNLRFSPFYFCINVLRSSGTALSAEGDLAKQAANLDKKPWYKPSTIAFLNLYPSAIQSISSLVAGICKKSTPSLAKLGYVFVDMSSESIQISKPNYASEGFIHTEATLSIWAGLSRHIHQKSIEFIFHTDHVYASIFYLRCYWLYLYNHFFPSEFFFSCFARTQDSKTEQSKPNSQITKVSLPAADAARQSLLLSKRAKTAYIPNLMQTGRRQPGRREVIQRQTGARAGRIHKMIIETTKTQGAHKILSSNFSARRLKSRYYSSSHCICVPSYPVSETRPGAGGHAKKLISLVLHRKSQKNQKPNFNDFLLKTASSRSCEAGSLPSRFAGTEKQPSWNNRNKAKRWASLLSYKLDMDAQHNVRKIKILHTDIILMGITNLIGLSF